MATKKTAAGTPEAPLKLKSLDPPAWVWLGGADEQKTAAEGWGLLGRFGVYVPPVLEALGLVELEQLSKNNRVKAK